MPSVAVQVKMGIPRLVDVSNSRTGEDVEERCRGCWEDHKGSSDGAVGSDCSEDDGCDEGGLPMLEGFVIPAIAA